MAKPPPSALRLREIKYGAKSSRDDRVRTGRELLEAGRVAEALDLFLLAGDDEAAGEVRALAVKQGRPLWLIQLRRGGRAVTQKDWVAAGRAAEADGRLREAYRAFLEARDEASLARIQEKLPGYEIYTPQGK